MPTTDLTQPNSAPTPKIPKHFRELINQNPTNTYLMNPLTNWNAYNKKIDVLENLGGWPLLLSMPTLFIDGIATFATTVQTGTPPLLGSIIAIAALGVFIPSLSVFVYTSNALSQLAELTEISVRTWLKNQHQITPVQNAFNREKLAEFINAKKHSHYSFKAEDGDTYTLKQEPDKQLISVKKINPATNPSATTQQEHATPIPTATQNTATLSGNLEMFPAADQHALRQAKQLINMLQSDTTLTVESAFALNRATKIIDESIDLARKLDYLTGTSRETAFGDLATSIQSALAELRTVDETRAAGPIKQARILAAYSTNLHPTTQLDITTEA